jgi:type IV secretory pathway ATPase VirB11/archaellum biosynthesis ATPase
VLRDQIDRLRSADADESCRCRVAFDDGGDRVSLTVDAADCPGAGDPAGAVACRRRLVDALTGRDTDVIRVTHAGRVSTYAGRGAALLVAAGRFRERVAVHDTDLADRVRTDPLGAARAATGRAGPVSRIAAETGLSASAAGVDGYESVFGPAVAPVGALGRVRLATPDSEPTDQWELPTGGVVRRYATETTRPLLHLTPAAAEFDPPARRALARARERLATGTAVESQQNVATGTAVESQQNESTDPTGKRALTRAVHAVVGERSLPTEQLIGTLRRHTRGLGFLTDLLTVPGVTDLWLTAPVPETPVRVARRDERARTNVRLSAADARALASRVRAESGRGLSRADPSADATLDAGPAGDVRVAAVTEPASDGPAFALRLDRDETAWTLPRLVAVDTLSARAAALLSLAVERGAAGLVAGPRGAGKTTTLGALLWAIPSTVRTVVIEDTPELPISALHDHDRDVQRLAVDTAFTPTAAVRTALRLGEGALVIGEVRGEEARALYEAMRVGAAADAVLGTIHGTGAAAVRERVVSDLGVPPSAFAATEFVVTLGSDHRLHALEEVRSGVTSGNGQSRSASGDEQLQTGSRAGRAESTTENGDTTTFQTLFDRDGSTGVIHRGESRLLTRLTTPAESYSDTLSRLDRRTRHIQSLAVSGRTGPDVSLRPPTEASP